METLLVWGFWGLIILWCIGSLSKSFDSTLCPACRKSISKQATVCAHCHSQLR